MTARVTIPLRLTPELHAQLKAFAKEERRSLNAFLALNLARLAANPLARLSPRLGGTPAKVRKVGPNEKCPCGSETKYKRCHGNPAIAFNRKKNRGDRVAE